MEVVQNIVSSFINSTEELVYEPLKGGGSAATLYRFDFNQSSYVLRLFPPQASVSTRKHQFQLAKEAGKLGFGPKIHFVDSSMNGLIMDFIPGEILHKTDRQGVIRFAQFLRKLHNSSANFPLAVSPFIRFNNFQSKMEAYPERFFETITLMNDFEAIFKQFPTSLVPSHLDLHPLNILHHENQFFLVDWVNGGMSDPYFDLATFCIFHDLNEENQLLFLNHYFGRAPNALECDRFFITQPIRPLVVAAALFSLEGPGSNLGTKMLLRGLGLMEQDAFKASFQNLKLAAKNFKKPKKNSETGRRCTGPLCL